jgi:predicted nucleic acid-binding Zn ribbon protein
VYCSRDCYFAGKTKRKEERISEEQARIWHCRICGRAMNKSGVYCGDGCRKEKARKDYDADRESILSKVRTRYKAAWRPPLPFHCKECGRKVEIEYGNKRDRYCSELCMVRSVKRNSRHSRAARKHEGFVEPVYLAQIVARDKGRCHICGKKINMKLKSPHRMSLTIDHVIPLARGGTHEPKNVRLAHMICNSIKNAGASTNGDQLLLFG